MPDLLFNFCSEMLRRLLHQLLLLPHPLRLPWATVSAPASPMLQAPLDAITLIVLLAKTHSKTSKKQKKGSSMCTTVRRQDINHELPELCKHNCHRNSCICSPRHTPAGGSDVGRYGSCHCGLPRHRRREPTQCVVPSLFPSENGYCQTNV